jgi:hypothetical protein
VAYWQRTFNAMESGMDSWDYAWLFSCWRCGGLLIRPNVNLVLNIGLGPDATHTLQPDYPAGRAVAAIPMPLHQPPQLEENPAQEDLLKWVNFSGMLMRQLHTAAQRIGAQCAARTAG